MLDRWLGRSLGCVLLGGLALSVACEAPAPDARLVAKQRQPIIGGTPAPNEDNVVAVQLQGGLCSGALISDRVVLTAKHCVQMPGDDGPLPASQLVVGVGSEYSWFGQQSNLQQYRALKVVTTPGPFNEADLESTLMGHDVALITLEESPGVKPLLVKLTDPSDESGRPAVAIGYGATPSSQYGGTKMRVDTRVTSVSATGIRVDNTICHGDSGGPLINSNGEIIGVVSVGLGSVDEQCPNGPGYYNRIDIFADMIRGAVEDAASCSSASEPCDGFDNDCDGQIDEDCKADGQACDDDLACSSRLCVATGSGKVCSSRCDPFGENTCADGMVCVVGENCGGVCAPGKLGSKGFGEKCDGDSECGSLFCHDAGDGVKRCLQPCYGGQGQCLGGEACLAQDGVCGSCIDAGRVQGKLGQDEPCESEADCRSGLCFDDSGVKYCSGTCTGDVDCDKNHHCRDMVCVRGARGEYGDSCRDTDDCAAGYFCAKNKQGQFCTKACDTSCPEGFSCTMVSNGKACLPDHSVVGGTCAQDSDCLSGECFEDGKVCTRSCDSAADCGPGLDCVRSALGSPGACLDPNASDLAPPDEPGKGGDGDKGDGDGDQSGDGDNSGDGDGDGDGKGNADGGNKSDSGDCSVRGTHTGSSGALLSVFALGLGLATRRRRRSR